MSRRRSLGALGAIALLFSFSGCGSEPAQQPPSSNGGGTAAAGKSGENGTASATGPAAPAESGAAAIDVRYVLPEHFAALIIHPRQIAATPLAAEQLKEKAVAEEIKEFGIDPSEVEEVVGLLSMGAGRPGATEPQSVFIARFTHDIDPKETFAKFAPRTSSGEPRPVQEVHLAGKICFASGDASASPLGYAPDKRTLVVAEPPLMEKVIASSGPSGPLYERLKKVDTSRDVVGVLATEKIPDFGMLVESAKKGFPPPMNDYLDAAKNVRGGVLYVSLTGDKLLELAIDNKDAETAGDLQKLLDDGKKMLGGLVAGGRQSLSPDMKAAFADALKLGDEAIDGLSIAKNGSEVAVVVKRPPSMDQLAGPALDKIKKMVREQNAKVMRANNLKQIAIALVNYGTAMRHFPAAAIYSKDHKPLLSWRVELLPQLGEVALYKEFKLDEPWDSPANRAAAKKMPAIYQTPGHENDGMTAIEVFAGKETLFDGEQTMNMSDIHDGASNTILAVEAGPDKAVPWTKPEDLPFDPANPRAALGDVPASGFAIAFCDGSVFGHAKPDDATLKAMITPAGGEPVNKLKLFGR